MQKPDQTKKTTLQPPKPFTPLKLDSQTPIDFFTQNNNMNKDIFTQNQNLTQNQNYDQKNDVNNSTSLYDAQSSFYQNMNISQSKSGTNTSQLPKEYFNCAFFTRKMSSKSSDVDPIQSKDQTNDFFKFRLGSNFSKDSSQLHNFFHKPEEEMNSVDFDYNIDKDNNLFKNDYVKDDPSQIFLKRAKSAIEQKKSNFVLKSSFFDKKTGEMMMQENKIFNNTNKENLLLKYYSINQQDYSKSKNQNLKKLLDDVNERDDDEYEDEDESNEEDDSVKEKTQNNFILNKKKSSPFKLVHRVSQDIISSDKENSPTIKNSEISRVNTFSAKKKMNLYSHDFMIDNDENKKDNKENEEDNDSNNTIDENFKNDISKKDNNDEKDFNKNNINNDEINSNKNNVNQDINNVNNNNILNHLFNINNNNNVVNNNEINNNNTMNYLLNNQNINTNNNQMLLNYNNNNNNNSNITGITFNPNTNTFVNSQFGQNNNQFNKNNQLNINNNPLLNINNANNNLNNNNNLNYYSMNETPLINDMNKLHISNNNSNNELSTNNSNNNSQIKQQPFNYANPDINDLLNNLTTYIKNQTGCRFIQDQIDKNPTLSNSIFDSLYYDLYSMSSDLFGNYVIQKLLENIDPQHLLSYMEIISKDFSKLAISNYGTRVVQKLLEIVSTYSETTNVNFKDIYVKCFKSINYHIIKDLVELSSNNNSSHIIIKYVNEIRYPKNVELFEEVYKNFIPLCKDKYGCCVIQKCIDSGNEEQKNKLLELSNSNCENLISDQFGNYVIQFVVCLDLKIVNQKILEILKNNLCSLCKEKYASNVIEKFLVKKSDESKEVINILLNDEKVVHELIIDKYGNYIIQRILSLIDNETRSNLIHKIVALYQEIKNLPFGPRIISKLHERYQEFTMLVTKYYGNESFQETLPYLHLNNFKNNNQFNNLLTSMNANNNPNLFINNNLNGAVINNNNEYNNYQMRPNNNCMDFKNKSNIGNINFIQMNNYMIPNGHNQNAYNNNELMKNFGGNKNNHNFYQQRNQNYGLNNANNQMMNNMGNNMMFNQGNNLEGNNMGLNYLMNNQNQLNYQNLMNMNSYPNMQQ